MMKLSRESIGQMASARAEWPSAANFDYPEKVLQFGTGVLLRALPGYFIDKANKQGIFKGRIIVVKSTSAGDVQAFSRQDNLYTLCVRGLESGHKIEENIVNASISRVLVANDQWAEVLAAAADPNLEIVISNTTEVGIVLTDDDVHASPPQSFPGKLLAFLYQRYKIFDGDQSKGMVVIPTELLPDNGKKLLSILLSLSAQNALEPAFTEWLTQCNEFCNSLVDRIVPGKLPAAAHKEMETALGYQDELMIMSETYRLWAIETSSEKTREILSFSKADAGVVIAPDIHIFRELKLRLLNGSHTLGCGLAHLAGFVTVKEAMADPAYADYVQTLMMKEIVPVIVDQNLSRDMAVDFANKVLDRYRNPYIEHKWLSITVQYASKMHMRDVPLLLRYVEQFGTVPAYIALGWAAHLLFMKSDKQADGQYYGEINGKKYLVNDNKAAHYAEQWKRPEQLAQVVLADKNLWGTDLSMLSGFVAAVSKNLQWLQDRGAKEILMQWKQQNK
jgi:tagaturonate reductase